MFTRHTIHLALAALALMLPADARRELLSARQIAYDANIRNDAAGMSRALESLEGLENDPSVGTLASYYAAWTAWSLGGSQAQAKDVPAALHTFEVAVAHARRAIARRPDSADFQAMLANALIGTVVMDRSRFEAAGPELRAARAAALSLGPRNPRVVLLDAGMIFNAPPERGGSPERGIERWLEAIALFEEEAKTAPADDLQPRWGLDIAYGGLASLYLRVTPPDVARARAAADKALSIRPDFWYVRTVLLPQLPGAR